MAVRGQSSSLSTVFLEWNPVADSNVVGYFVYEGGASGNYSTRIDAGNDLTIEIADLSAGQAYYFAVTTYDAAGNESLPSNESYIVVPRNGLPELAGQLGNVTADAGATASFTVLASGTPPFTYQWLKNSVPIAGATTATLAFAAVTDADTAAYSVVVSNSLGSVTSAAAGLRVVDAPYLIRHALSQTNNAGTTATFSVVAGGTPPIACQWIQNGTNVLIDGGNVSGSGTTSLTLTNVLGADAGQYTVFLLNAAETAASPPAYLAVIDPIILSPPSSRLLPLGAPAQFSVNAYGTAPAYQWLKNGVPIAGANAAALAFAGVGDADGAAYSVVVSNGFGSVTSAVATLSVIDPPSIITPAVSLTNNAGTSVTFSVVAGGTPPFSYQWIRDGTNFLRDGGNISGSGTAGLTLSRVLEADAGQYTVSVANGVGTAVGAAVVLTVVDPAILTPPSSLVQALGASAQFSVDAYGTAVTYQWQKNGVPITGATSSALLFAGVGDADTAGYSVVVSNVFGSVTSAVAGLIVIDPPSIITQAGSRTNNAGTAATFTVVAGGTGPMNYQWIHNETNFLRDGGNICGSGTASLTLSNVMGGDAGQYQVTVGDYAGTLIGAPSSLTVIDPVITNQPKNQAVAPGVEPGFAVGASGSAPLNYQWQYNGTTISGATNSSLTFTNLPSNVAGFYQVLVTSPYGSVTSSIATLSILGFPVSFVTSTDGISFANGQLSAPLTDLTGQGPVVIQASTNLIDWLPILTNPPAFGQMLFTIPSGTNYPFRFFRALTPPAPF
jgi:hypothetical protein